MKCKDCQFFRCEAADLGKAGIGHCTVLDNYEISVAGETNCKYPERCKYKEMKEQPCQD